MNSTEMLQALATNGGFSFNPTTGMTNPTCGYMVSQKGKEKAFTNPTEADIDAYIKGHGRLERTAFIGGWVNEGVTYLDVSNRILRKEIAINLGRRNGQKAIWDCAAGKDIILSEQGIVL